MTPLREDGMLERRALGAGDRVCNMRTDSRQLSPQLPETQPLLSSVKKKNAFFQNSILSWVKHRIFSCFSVHVRACARMHMSVCVHVSVCLHMWWRQNVNMARLPQLLTALRQAGHPGPGIHLSHPFEAHTHSDNSPLPLQLPCLASTFPTSTSPTELSPQAHLPLVCLSVCLFRQGLTTVAFVSLELHVDRASLYVDQASLEPIEIHLPLLSEC